MYEIPKTLMIKNCNLWNTWALACYAVNKYGVLVPSGPNYTNNPDYVPPNIKEVTMTIEHGPESINQILDKALPPMYPQKQGVDDYINQLTPGTKEFEHGRKFHYTYGLRLREILCPRRGTFEGEECPYNNIQECESYDVYCIDNEIRCYIDQLEFIAKHLDAFNKRMQAITWIPEIDLYSTIMDEMKQSVPCLQRIRIENYYDEYYILTMDWRSRDLYKAHPYNMVGLINSIDTLIQETREKQGQSKLKLVKIVEFIDSLHIYEPELEVTSRIPIDVNTIMNCLYI
jgi:thymidylate synthase